MEFKLGELFCGPGGIGYAAVTARIENSNFKITHAWANDYDRYTCNTYEINVAKKKGTIVCSDIRRLDFKRLEKISAIDALAFGFPCNDFSMVGEQKEWMDYANKKQA
jgi:DNA (cytosine-5)-methyltransferase 1